MLADSRIVYLFIYVSDVRASRRFYEDKLGLRLLEADDDSAMYDCGTCVLALQTAGRWNVDLPVDRDNSTDVVWMVDDMEATQKALEARGVKFVAPVWYEVGGIVDFYDPDFHWLTLYQPSEQSLEWPSGERISAVRAARNGHNGGARVHGGGPADAPLRDAELIYSFFFVPNAEATERFYHDDLGIRDIEGGPCSQQTDNDEEGVIKYDTGGMMLTTHFYDQTRTQDEVDEHGCPPRILDMERMKGVAPAFHVRDVKHTVKALQQRRPDFKPRLNESSIGVVATCEDPGGHMFFLWEPSEQSLAGPVGEKVQEILGMRL
jgi:catechol 2,3-dioxygenase-like lactoylglutathione lyase family enzyme